MTDKAKVRELFEEIIQAYKVSEEVVIQDRSINEEAAWADVEHDLAQWRKRLNMALGDAPEGSDES